MKHAVVAVALAATLLPIAAAADATAPPAPPAPPPKATVTGIPLDAPWKVTVYQLARKTFIHPAWGWQHSERNYNVGVALATGDGLHIDRDVLFAACFLHDMAAFAPYAREGHTEHGDVAAEESVAVLRDAGFPMDKIAGVQAAEHGHMYYTPPGNRPEAMVLHDADSLDFLGDIAAARMLALVGEKGDGVAPIVKALRHMVADIPPKLVTRTGRAMGQRRAAELKKYLDALDAEASKGALL